MCVRAVRSYSFNESRPCVMTPVNSVSLRASISNQWIRSSAFAHHAPPLMLSSSSEPWEPHRPEHMPQFHFLAEDIRKNRFDLGFLLKSRRKFRKDYGLGANETDWLSNNNNHFPTCGWQLVFIWKLGGK